MRRKRATPEAVKQLQREGKRCSARHPNWHGVRCERDAGMFGHRAHRGEDFEWVDGARAA